MRLFRNLFANRGPGLSDVHQINNRRTELENHDNEALRRMAPGSGNLIETIAITAVVAERLLGLRMFDVQLMGALTLAHGDIAEMQTGEGKTLAAVPAVVWLAREKLGVHVMTANDYLARRDSAWMKGIFEFMGLTVGCIQQGMMP